ncbi:TolC family protein [Thiomicrorhabdus aquaedulcis]|uniref:TolC family protein n=1 Tax=Thiomicrorhabdus aquaedulcis TaxID=2211106 RepID=UPI000FD94EB7|nr:TolC family protein [Thiomicrorhabdus aquaedulcis]
MSVQTSSLAALAVNLMAGFTLIGASHSVFAQTQPQSPVQTSVQTSIQTQTAPSLSQVAQAVYQRLAEQTLLTGYEQVAQAQSVLKSGFLAEGVTVNLKHQSDALTEQTGQFSWEGGVALPLGLGAQNQARRELSTLYGAQRDAYERLLQSQASGVARQSVWTVKKAQAILQHATEQEAVFSQLTQQVQQAVKAGEQPQLDLVLARKAQAQANTQRLAALTQLNQAWSSYEYWTGLNTLPNDVMENFSNDLSGSTGSSGSIALSDVSKHPKVQWQALQVQKAQGQLALERAQSKPKSTLFLGAVSEQDAQTSARSQLIAEVSIPLGTPESYQAAMAEQAYGVSEQNSALLQAQQTVQQSVRLQALELQAFGALQQSLKEALAQSQQVYDMAKAGYQQGETPMATLLLAQQQQLQSQLDWAISEVEYGQKISAFLQERGDNLVTQDLSTPPHAN